MSLVFTMPGKLGDSLHEFPVAYWYCVDQKTTCTIWLDETTCKPLVKLFAAQPFVDAVELKPGITSWHMGGQPWDFGLSMKDHMDHEIYHLGMRRFPMRQITLDALDQVPLSITRRDNQRCLTVVSPAIEHRRLVLHGTFMSHMSGVPGFWRFLSDQADDLATRFDEIVFVGTDEERARALEVYPQWTSFDDQGDFLKLAEFMANAKMVIGSGSSNVVLASLLGIPCVRVHDPIGEYAKVIWSNLGENQINDTERELRDTWPAFRDRWLHVGVEAPA